MDFDAATYLAGLFTSGQDDQKLNADAVPVSSGQIDHPKRPDKPEPPAAGCDPPTPAPRDERPADLQRQAHADARGDPHAPAPWRLPPWPPVVDPRIIADPVPECRECGRPRVIPGQPGRPVGLCYPCWLKANRENAPGTNAKAVA